MKKLIVIITLFIVMFTYAISYNLSIVKAKEDDEKVVLGDLNSDNVVDTRDVIYLLMHTYFPNSYQITQNCDYTGDGKVNTNDVIYLLMYTYFPDDYPINNSQIEVPEYQISYDLGYEQFDTKNDLYVAYFTEFYNFLIEHTDCDLNSYNISNGSDFINACSNWNFNNFDAFYGVANAFSKYYLTIDIGGTLDEQPIDTFIGYCYQNNKFKDVIEHLEVFFAYWRTDEGYTTATNNGNDFFASAWASLVDTCKFFYFTSSNLTDTYPWFTKEKSPRVYYMLDNIPGVGEVDLLKESTTTVTLPKISRMHYTFLGWYDENGHQVTKVTSNAKVMAKWERINYLVEYYNGNEIIECYVPSGTRVSRLNLEKEGYQVVDIVKEDGTTFDFWSAIGENTKIFVLWQKEPSIKGSVNVVGVNSQDATSTMEKYYGIRLYKSGVEIGTSRYWYKVGIKYQNNEYIVTSILESGQPLQSDYDYLILAWNDDYNNDYQALVELNIQIGDVVVFPQEPSNYSNGENVFMITFKENDNLYNLYLVDDSDETLKYNSLIGNDEKCQLPIPTKKGYTFLGWYDNPNFSGDDYVSFVPTQDIILYAKWEKIIIDDALDYISDVVSSDTIDELPLCLKELR